MSSTIVNLTSDYTKSIGLLLSGIAISFADNANPTNNIDFPNSVGSENSVLTIIDLRTTSLGKDQTANLDSRKSIINIMT